MSQITSSGSGGGGGSGTVTSVSGGTGINITGTPTVNPTVNLIVPVTVPNGGTANTTFTAYSVITAGTTATGSFQNVAGVGTLGQYLQSQGAGALPQWVTDAGSSGASIFDTDSGTANASSNTITIHGGNNISTSGTAATVTINVSGTTNHTVQIGNSTGSLTSIANGTTGQVLTAQTGADPIWATGSGGSGIVTIDGDVSSVTGTTVTLTGGTSGAVFTGNGTTTMTESFNFLAMPATNTLGTQGYISMGGTVVFQTYDTIEASVYVGKNSGNITNTGFANTAVGQFSLEAVTSGNQNTAIGAGVLQKLTTGTFNVAVGIGGGGDFTTGSSNTFLGYNVATTLVSGSSNILLGDNSGNNYTGSESSNICIGAPGILAESNAIHIGTQGSGAGDQNVCYIAGIAGVSVSNINLVTINTSTGQLGSQAAPTAFTWSVITANQTAAVGNGYICNKAGTLALALPATSAVGSIIEVTGINTATGWQITQATGQQVFYGTSSTTSGATGTLTSSAIRDSIKMVCVVANTTWNVLSSVGNISVV